MNRTVRTGASLVSLIALLTDCGGHTAEQGAIEGPPTVPGAGGDPATVMAGGSGSGSAATGSKTESAPEETNSGGTNGSAPSATEGGGATNGNGGTPSGSGGAANGSGGAVNADGGLAGGTGATLSAPKPQVWVGALEWYVTYGDIYKPPLAHEHAVLVLNPEGMDDVGSMVLGDAAPPPPPTDPNVYYPPQKGGSGILVTGELQQMLVEGVPYSLRDVRRTDTRLTFHLNPTELWKDWCKLRTACSQNIVPPDLAAHEPNVDDLCGNNTFGVPICDCDDSICHWNPAIPLVWTIDVELRNGILEGQVAKDEVAAGGIQTFGIRLKRVE